MFYAVVIVVFSFLTGLPPVLERDFTLLVQQIDPVRRGRLHATSSDVLCYRGGNIVNVMYVCMYFCLYVYLLVCIFACMYE